MNFEPRDIQGLDARHVSDSSRGWCFKPYDVKKDALRKRTAMAFWAILAIAGFACAIKLFDVI